MEISMDLISVIIPVYNTEEYLDSCIESVLNQSYKELEIIIVNDGSTDNSLEVIRKYAEKDARIKVIDKVNEGVSCARNTALKASKGKYIQFVDSDDLLDLSMLEKLHTSMVKSGADIAVCGIKQQYTDRVVERKVTNAECSKQIAELGKYLYSFDVTASSVNKLYKRQILGNEFYPEGLSTCEDLVFNRYAFANAKSIVLLPELLYINRQRKDSACHRVLTKELVAEHYQAINRASQLNLKTDDKTTGIYWDMVPALLLFTLANAVMLQENKDNAEVLKYLVENEAFWKYYDMVVLDGKKAQVKKKMLSFLLKHKMFKFAILISKVYDSIKKNN
ncbi:MAG: glycosyltransferase [Clostridia bacterium]|nr:glycosyltransferase [Clostridia bacterium]